MTSGNVTQVGTELWSATSDGTKASVTQVGAELWTETSTSGTQGDVSQVGNELWMAVPVPTQGWPSQVGAELWIETAAASPVINVFGHLISQVKMRAPAGADTLHGRLISQTKLRLRTPIPGPPFPPGPPIGPFPPPGLTTLTKTIPSYLYQEYNDDDDLQAFVRAYNTYEQAFVDWFNALNLPVYTSPTISGALLDWVAEGLYGMRRPLLPSGRAQIVGPYNTWAFNTIAYNTQKSVGSDNFFITTDDIFKRIMTWNLYKGDGKVFNIAWLKRRIMRFLLGANGTDANIDNTYLVSVVFDVTPGQVDITIDNTSGQFTVAPQLASAISVGAVELPFQFTYDVTVTS